MIEPNYLTSKGAAKLKEELAVLKGTERIALAVRLRDAISMGDLSENADYHKAKEDQAFLEGRIQELEHLLNHATVVENPPKDHVFVGNTIVVQEEGEPEESYYIVGAYEANVKEGKISHESPLGKALFQRKVGEKVTVSTPSGSYTLKIIRIE